MPKSGFGWCSCQEVVGNPELQFTDLGWSLAKNAFNSAKTSHDWQKGGGFLVQGCSEKLEIVACVPPFPLSVREFGYGDVVWEWFE